MRAVLVSVLMVLCSSVFAHEGHDDAPGSVKAFHGGVVKTGRGLNLEVISTAGELKVFPLAHGGGDIPLNEVKLVGTAQPPKGKALPIAFESKDGAFYSKIDFKGAYRLSVELKAEYKGKIDKIKVQVEQ